MASAYFDLRKSFTFYGSFHRNPVNKWIHIVFVPTIFTTSISLIHIFLSDWVHLPIFIFYVTSYINMEALSGVLFFPVMTAMYFAGIQILPQNLSALSIFGLWSLGWVAQFIGHGVFEKKAPSLLTNLPQSLHASVFFVWVELLFSLGYQPALRAALENEIEKRVVLNKESIQLNSKTPAR